jgi:hypothetical protein
VFCTVRKTEFVRSFFGRIRGYQIFFRNYLTFTREGEEETIGYFYLLFMHAALLSHVKKSVNEGKLCDPFAKLIDSMAKKRKPDGTDQENAIMHDCSLRVIVLWRRNEPQSTKTSNNSWGVFLRYSFFQ